jgi:preprotein translocase subunit SecD
VDVAAGPDTRPGEEASAVYYLVRRTPVITGRDFVTVSVSKDVFNQPAVFFSLSPAAAARFSEYSAAHVGSQLAIVVDGRVLSAPRIENRIGGEGQITGHFTAQEAEDLAHVLRAGPLPAPVTVLQQRTVGPRR